MLLHGWKRRILRVAGLMSTSWRTRERVLSTQLPDGGSVLLDLDGEEYFGLNEVGTAVWEGLRSGTSIDDIVLSILSEYEAAEAVVRSDIEGLLDRLAESGLIVDADEE